MHNLAIIESQRAGAKQTRELAQAVLFSLESRARVPVKDALEGDKWASASFVDAVLSWLDQRDAKPVK